MVLTRLLFGVKSNCESYSLPCRLCSTTFDPSRAEPASASYDEALPYVSVDYWVAAGFDRGIACALSDTAGRSAL